MTEGSRPRVAPTGDDAIISSSSPEPERSTIDAPSEGESINAAPSFEDEARAQISRQTREDLEAASVLSCEIHEDAPADGVSSLVERNHIFQLQPITAPQHGREVFETSEQVLACIANSGEFARQIRIAAFLDEDHLRVRPNFVIEFRCSDGRCVDYHFMQNDLLHTLYAEEHVPQAGLLIVPGTEQITSVDGPTGVRAFYDVNEARITRVLDSLLREPILHELRWQQRYLAQHGQDPGAREDASYNIVKNKRITVSLKSHSQGADYLELLDAHGVGAIDADSVPVAEVLPEDEAIATSAFQRNARHGCGAHGSWMPGALLESAKEALLIDEYLRRSFPDEYAKGQFNLLRQHQFTGERTRNVLAQDVDGRLLDATGTHLLRLPPDFALAVERFNLTNLERQQAVTDGLLRLVEKEGSHELIEHNPTEHAEQVIAFTNNPGAYAIPNFDMLDQAWSDDPEKNRAVGIKLIDIALGEKNFGGKNPDAKIFVLLDRPFRPDYRKDAKWANDWSSLRERIELLPQDARPTPEEWATMEQAYAANPGSPEQPLLFHFLSALPPRIRLTPKQLAWTAAIRRGFNDRKLPALQVVQQKLAPDLSANGEDKGWNMLVKFDRVPITDPEELWLIEGDNTRSMELQKQLERDLRAHIESNPHARGRVEIVPVATNRRSYKVHRDLFLSGSYKVPPKVRAQPAARTDASSE